MRLVTWNLGHRPGGTSRPDRLVTALAALAPDIAILVDRTAGAFRKPLRDALAAVGLGHQLANGTGARRGSVLLASRVAMVRGSLEEDPSDDAAPPHMLHAYSPSGVLDVLGLGTHRGASRPAARAASWDWLLGAAALLRQRRAIVIGDFETSDAGGSSLDASHLRRFTDDGWHNAVPAEREPCAKAGGDRMHLDHAFLSPSVQRIDARYALEAAGMRLAGSQDALAERPALVVDLQ